MLRPARVVGLIVAAIFGLHYLITDFEGVVVIQQGRGDDTDAVNEVKALEAVLRKTRAELDELKSRYKMNLDVDVEEINTGSDQVEALLDVNEESPAEELKVEEDVRVSVEENEEEQTAPAPVPVPKQKKQKKTVEHKNATKTKPAPTPAVATTAPAPVSPPPATAQVATPTLPLVGTSKRLDALAEKVDPNKKRFIVFMHVGKAAGSTIEGAFKRIRCHSSNEGFAKKAASEGLLETCRAQNYTDPETGTESLLSKSLGPRMHMGKMEEWALAQYNVTSFLFSTRNPISRFYSAFSYAHPNRTRTIKNQTHLGPFVREDHPREVYGCLYHISDIHKNTKEAFDLLENGLTPQQYNDHPFHPTLQDDLLTTCQKIPLVGFPGERARVKVAKFSFTHLFFNYEYYVKYSIDRTPQYEVFAARTEHLQEDLTNIDVLIGGDGVVRQIGARNTNTHRIDNNLTDAQTNKKIPVHLLQSPENHRLCCILYREMDAYQKIILRALNLDKSDKKESLGEIMEACGAEQYVQSSKLNTVDWFQFYHNQCPPLDDYHFAIRLLQEQGNFGKELFKLKEAAGLK